MTEFEKSAKGSVINVLIQTAQGTTALKIISVYSKRYRRQKCPLGGTGGRHFHLRQYIMIPKNLRSFDKEINQPHNQFRGNIQVNELFC